MSNIATKHKASVLFFTETWFHFFSLEFGTAPAAEPGAPPIVTNDILAMISPEKESVPLLKVL